MLKFRVHHGRIAEAVLCHDKSETSRELSLCLEAYDHWKDVRRYHDPGWESAPAHMQYNEARMLAVYNALPETDRRRVIAAYDTAMATLIANLSPYMKVEIAQFENGVDISGVPANIREETMGILWNVGIYASFKKDDSSSDEE